MPRSSHSAAFRPTEPRPPEGPELQLGDADVCRSVAYEDVASVASRALREKRDARQAHGDRPGEAILPRSPTERALLSPAVPLQALEEAFPRPLEKSDIPRVRQPLPAPGLPPASARSARDPEHLADLERRIRAIEGWQATVGRPEASDAERAGGDEALDRKPSLAASARAALTFGCEVVDGVLPGGGLDAGLHEMKPQAYGDWPAAVACALALAGRRSAPSSARHGHSRPSRSSAPSSAPILFCLQARSTREMGQLYAPGLEALGLAMERIILVETAREADTLWAMEDGLRSASLAAVVGISAAMPPTPARRLALAAREHATPCLVLTPPAADGALCALTRWRIGRSRSAPCPAASGAPGAPRFQVVLDRCRQGGRPIATSQMFLLDWYHEAFCFRMAAQLADRTHAAGRAGQRAC